MKEWLIKYWLQVIFGAILTGIAWCLRIMSTKLKRKLSEQEAIKLGIQALLRDRLIQSYNHYIEKGFCPIYALENINALYTQYHALGGNGTVTEILVKLKALPTEIQI
jgi:hypothetical protein